MANTSTQPEDATIKDRVSDHYKKTFDKYQASWGGDVHVGYYSTPTDTQKLAQTQLTELLIERSSLQNSLHVLDVGCGVGGTGRYLANNWGCHVTGITIGTRQVEIARELTLEAGGVAIDEQSFKLGHGSVSFLTLDAERMGEFFTTKSHGRKFDCVWDTETLCHIPGKRLFFANCEKLLKQGGKLVIGDWFKGEGLSEEQYRDSIVPIENGSALSPLCTQSDFVRYAEEANLKTFAKPLDISKEVSRTYDSHPRDSGTPEYNGLPEADAAGLEMVRRIQKGLGNGAFQYSVMTFQK